MTDTADSTPVVVVDEYSSALLSGSERAGPSDSARRTNSPRLTIVGVVGTINSIDLAQPVIKERIYYPVTQQSQPAMAVVLKTGLDPTRLIAELRHAVLSTRSRSADLKRPDDGRLDLAVPRDATHIDGAAGSLRRVALVLSAIGIYGVLAFGVAQRVREFGIDRRSGRTGVRFCRWC